MKLFTENEKYLQKIFTEDQLSDFKADLETGECTLSEFMATYIKHVKAKHTTETLPPTYDPGLTRFLDNPNKIKVVWGNCLENLKKLPDESIQLMVTSPPYYNARKYSIWDNIELYMNDMRQIIKECYRVLDNHRVFVFNVGDIYGNDNMKTKSVWGKRRIPLSAYFIVMFEELGFTFYDDIIWDKGEVQSQRHKNKSTPYPFYQQPFNAYEHILIFHKHRLDPVKYPCQVCGSLNVSGNSYTRIGLKSWECKNNACTERSAANRGKRYSLKTISTQDPGLREENVITEELQKKWRKDIIHFSPVIKINCKGKNSLGHTAPFPADIPEMAVKFFSYKNDKVLDMFAGSFTTCIVANKLGRNGIGFELRKDLFEDCIKKNLIQNKVEFEEFN